MSEPVDLVVLGSGGAGLTAALAAASQDACVVLVEKTDLLGGTTAMSGGTTWIPVNPYATAAGYHDSAEMALAYLCAGGGDTVNRPMLEAFVEFGATMLAFVERHTSTSFYLANDTDYHPELPGAMRVGRSILPSPFDPSGLGSWADRIRRVDLPLDIAEALGSLNPPEAAPGRRPLAGAVDLWTRGRALVGSLVDGCLERGVRFLTGERVRRLLIDSGQVVGVEMERDGSRWLRSEHGVVLASGGFEWAPDLVRNFLPAPLEAPGSPPSLQGDGLRMAMAAGAGLGSMAEAWWSPMIRVPGEEYDGETYSRMVVSQRLYPRSIVVNRSGRRFTDEGKSYHDVGRDLMAIDSAHARCTNRPAWLVFDAVYRRSYGSACVGPHDADPPWLKGFGDLAELARHHGIDADGLATTVDSFNKQATQGRDPVFHRGENVYSLSKGDRSKHGVFRTLGPLSEPPFYAVRLYGGTIGTRGGPLIDNQARVLDAWGGVIPGLFAAGNVSASPTGLLYPGAGGTLGLALTFGYIAGMTAVDPGRDDE